SKRRRGACARLRGWWLAACLLVAPGAVGAPETLRMGGDAHYPPYEFVDAQGRADGFDVALARAVARDMGVEPRFELGEWDVALKRLERGEIDVVPMFWSAERAQRFQFTQPILIRHHALFGTRTHRTLQSLDELANARVAVQTAGLAWEALQARRGDGVTPVELETEPDALLAVSRGEADYALVPTGIGYYTINAHGLRDVIALSPPLLERKYVFATTRGRTGLVARLDASLEPLRADGVQNDRCVRGVAALGGPRAHAERLARGVRARDNLAPRPRGRRGAGAPGLAAVPAPGPAPPARRRRIRARRRRGIAGDPPLLADLAEASG